jgi:NADH-quinone oxidoreductase subunit G
MDFAPSVCTSCARGCNVMMGARQGTFLRMEPAENHAVNRWWMCDAGRLDYRHVNSPTRLDAPRVRTEDGDWRATTWDGAIAEAASQLREAQGDVLLDGAATLEEMLIFQDLAGMIGGKASFAAPVADDGDDFLIVDEKGANAKGAELLGIGRQESPAKAVVLVVERDRNVPASLRDGTGALVVFATDAEHVPASAKVAFPYGSWAEREGIYVNVDGIAQHARALPSAGAGQIESAPTVVEEILLEMRASYDAVGREGLVDRLQAMVAFKDIELPGASAPVGSAS